MLNSKMEIQKPNVPQKISLDGDKLQKGLAKLVLVIVEFVVIVR